MNENLQELEIQNLFDLNETIASELFQSFRYPWEVLASIKEFICKIGPQLPESEYEKRGDDIWISKSALVYESAYLHGPLIICPGAEIRHCAFIRGSAIVGEDATVGNSTELKNAVLFNKAQAPHYNYVGDSILGYRSHMGAGAITSNLKSDKTNVTVRFQEQKIATGIRKFGAALGDNVEIGCGSVLNPGSVIGRDTMVYPLSMVRGYIPPRSIFKEKGNVVTKEP